MPAFKIGNRKISKDNPPFIIAEIGINHEGDLSKAQQMVYDAHAAGCECVKFQCHVIEDEMIPNSVIPGNATESIWDIMSRCTLTEEEDRELQKLTSDLGMIYLSTPFSRAAANRLQKMNLSAYKIGSGECNNYPLIRHIASFKKPIILSTGMNDINTIIPAVDIIRSCKVPFAILHCTSMYPTPYNKVHLQSIPQLQAAFPDAVIGLSDHSLGNWACFGAVALGASILEKHFTSDKNWPGPDIPISINPTELKELINGSLAVHAATSGTKQIFKEEQPTIDFAYACVVSIEKINPGDILTSENIWVKRPGTGEIKARYFDSLIGKTVTRSIPKNTQITWADIKNSNEL